MLEELQKELTQELIIIHQQRALDVNEMDEIDQSESQDLETNPENQKLNSYKSETKSWCLADTQRRQKYEKIVKDSKGNYYFYQLDDETNSFLDPLCMRVLLKEYGSYDNLPLNISSKILEIEEFNMTEHLRAKNKPISHLGISAEFKFIEVDMSHLVSYKTYEHFEKQIRSKENIRKRRREKEKKYMEKAKLIDEKKHEYYLKNNISVNINSKSRHIPVWDAEKTINDDTWFTLDGKEIKNDKINQPWKEDDENNEEDKEPTPEVEEIAKEDTDDNVWNDFEITPQGEPVDEFPALGGGPPQAQEKIPVIITKSSSKSHQKKVKKKPKPKLIEEEEGLFSNTETTFTIDQFMVSSKPKRNKNKRKGRR